LRTAIVAIHQLPSTPDTLWLRLLGRGKVQQRAIDEVEALPIYSPLRTNALQLLVQLRIILEAKQDTNSDDQELIMRLAHLYEEILAQKLAEATQKGVEQGLALSEQKLAEATQKGVEQGLALSEQKLAEATQKGVEQIACRMLDLGMSLEQISQATGLSPAQINQLQSPND
jgi:predicted transposase YdaD